MIAANQDELHGDTIERARLGNRINKNNAITEKMERVNGVGDMPNEHDILTGSTPDGRAYTDAADHTCSNWTSNANVEAPARGAAPPATPPPPRPLRAARSLRQDRWCERLLELDAWQPRLQPAQPRRHGWGRQAVLLRGELERGSASIQCSVFAAFCAAGPDPERVRPFSCTSRPCVGEQAVPETDTTGRDPESVSDRKLLTARHFGARQAWHRA